MLHTDLTDLSDAPAPEKSSPDEPSRNFKGIIFLRKILSVIIVFCILSIIFVTVLNVITRDMFASPLTGVDDIVQYILPLLIFAGLPIVTANESHFSVSLFTDRLRGRARKVQRNFIRLVIIVATGLIAFEMIEQVQSLISSNITTNILQLPMAPIFIVVSILCVITVLLVVFKFMTTNFSKKGM